MQVYLAVGRPEGSLEPSNGMEDDGRSSAGCQLGGCRSPVTSLSFQCCQQCPQHLALAQAQPCSILKQLPCASCVCSLRRCMSCHLGRQGRVKASVSRLGIYAQRQVCGVAAAEPRMAGPITHARVITQQGGACDSRQIWLKALNGIMTFFTCKQVCGAAAGQPRIAGPITFTPVIRQQGRRLQAQAIVDSANDDATPMVPSTTSIAEGSWWVPDTTEEAAGTAKKKKKKEEAAKTEGEKVRTIACTAHTCGSVDRWCPPSSVCLAQHSNHRSCQVIERAKGLASVFASHTPQRAPDSFCMLAKLAVVVLSLADQHA